MTEIVPLQDVVDAAREFMAQSKAPNTLRAYASDWRHYEAWCVGSGLRALPATPQTVALYLTAHAEALKVSTLQRRLTAIKEAHRQKGEPLDGNHTALREVWAGIKRTKGTATTGKAPTLTADIIAMVSALPDTLLGTRDRALLLVGFAGAFRRSELCALRKSDLSFTQDGLTVTIRRSKTDQEGQGRKVGIPFGSNARTCPVVALQAWIKASGIERGRVFRSITRHGKVNGKLWAQSVALVVKRSAKATGLDPSKLAGHSLRSGFATSAAAAGATERSIMKQTGHRSLPTLRGYIRDGSLFRENAASLVGL